MATIVPLSDEDPVLAVVRFTSELAWADAGPEVAEPQVSRLCVEAEDCMVMGRWLDLASLLLTTADLIFPRVSEKDLECIFTVICNLVTRASTLDEALEVVKLISAKVVQQPNDKPFSAFEDALHLAISGKVTEHVIPTFKKIDNLLKEWKLEKLDHRSLFLTIANILKDSKSMGKQSHSFLIKYLATFSTEDAYAMSEAKEEAVRAIIEFIKGPGMFQCDLLDMPAVLQLEKDGKYVLVYQLLKIFLTQRLDSYLDFHAANSTLLKSYGLVHEDCITKMRLMTLADLGSSDYGKISYAFIRDTLRITDEEVEHWVVKAITAKILDCKMNQMNQTVDVSHSTERVFGLSQWKALQSELGIWRGNIANVINTIQANRISEEAAVAM